MSNSILNQNTVLRQCLSLLPTKDLACPILNYGTKKLSIEALVKIFVIAQLDHWKSYPEFDIKMRAYKDLME
ncbi:IS4/IS5 family transposase, partial [Schinkia azotoformans]|nr:IS4/IS5 family transposase [Schinkia azotoformans]MED4415456.1 IS4/IS5 family transposase [Schinkia azotoformans]